MFYSLCTKFGPCGGNGGGSKHVSKLVFFYQSTGVVISGRYAEMCTILAQK